MIRNTVIHLLTTSIVTLLETSPAFTLDSKALGVTVAVQVYVSVSVVRRVLNSKKISYDNLPVSDTTFVTLTRSPPVTSLPPCLVHELFTVTRQFMVDSDSREMVQVNVNKLPAL